MSAIEDVIRKTRFFSVFSKRHFGECKDFYISPIGDVENLPKDFKQDLGIDPQKGLEYALVVLVGSNKLGSEDKNYSGLIILKDSKPRRAKYKSTSFTSGTLSKAVENVLSNPKMETIKDFWEISKNRKAKAV